MIAHHSKTVQRTGAKLLCVWLCVVAAQLLAGSVWGQTVAPPQIAQSKVASLQEQCGVLSAQQMLTNSQHARTPTQVESRFNVLPGGQLASVSLLAPPDADEYYCARFLEDGLAVKVIEVKASPHDAKKSELTLLLPDLGFGWQRSRQLVVMSFPVGQGNTLNVASPGSFLRATARSVARYQRCRSGWRQGRRSHEEAPVL